MTIRMMQRGVMLMVAAGVLNLATGCSHMVNPWVEDGPAMTMSWTTATEEEILAHYEPSEPHSRGWSPSHVSAESGIVYHWPLYFEDPFEDKGHGLTDEMEPRDIYHVSWEDYVAMPYGLARFTLNWLALPVSMIVTPPWTVMESDGQISKQLVWKDHDAVVSSWAEEARAEKASQAHTNTADEMTPDAAEAQEVHDAPAEPAEAEETPEPAESPEPPASEPAAPEK